MSEFYPDRQALSVFRFAMVDAESRERLPQHWPSTVVAPTFLGDDTDRCPVLIELSHLPSDERAVWCDQLHEDMQTHEPARASLLLSAEGHAARVARHLAQRLVVHMPGERQASQWRYFDSGTFLQMPRILGADGMAWLMGPVSAVQVPFAGHWTRIDRPSPAQADTFRLTPVHLAALLRISVITRVTAKQPPPSSPSDWMRDTAVIDAHVLRGQTRHGLSHRDDLVAFAHDAWTRHPRIDEHPRLISLLQQLRTARPEDELDYRELRSRLKPVDWADIVADLNTQKQEGTRP